MKQKTMLKQVMTQPGKIVFEQVDVPIPKVGQVLVKIMKIGVCGSDVHVYHGKHPFTKYPITQGHEVSARIEQLGEGVDGFIVGQKVTIEPQIFCGKCYCCRNNKYNLCEELKVMGFQTTGTASEYFAVDASKITLLPENLTYSQGAMIEPLAVTVHAAKRFNELAGAKVAVLGSGPIGVLLAQSCKALNAKEVMITDISDYRLEIAKACNIEHIINTKNENFNDAMLRCFGADKADVIFDCAGNDVTMGQAINYARKGSKIVLVAVYAGKANIDLAVLNDKELDLDTSMMYTHQDYVQAISLVSDGKILLEPLISKHFAFEDYLSAYKLIDENGEKTMKVLIDVDNSVE